MIKRLDWPHAPPHWLASKGTYFVTASTHRKALHFKSDARLDYLTDLLFEKTKKFGWRLDAWAVFPNHYHFVAKSPEEDTDATSLSPCLKQLHGASSVWVNRQDDVSGRKVWQNFRETQLTIKSSYLARLHYTHQNAVKHGVVHMGRDYKWCSARWFERHAQPAMIKTIYGFKIDRIRVEDEFEV